MLMASIELASCVRRSIVEMRESIRHRLRTHGRRRRTARRAARARRVPAALDDGPAVVAAHPGRGAADAGRGRARRGVDRPRRRRAGPARAPATSRSCAARTPTRSPTTRPRRRRPSSTPASAARRPTAQELAQMMEPRRPHLGQRAGRRDGDAHRHLPARRRGQPAPAARAAAAARAAGDAWDSPLVALLADEIVKDEPGQEAVLDRLLDLLLIAVLRAWFARPEADAPGLVPRPRRPGRRRARCGCCTTTRRTRGRSRTLADDAGVSRAALARRFNELVGEPPMSFLTGWRIALAADLLREPGATVGSVAAQVGYGSPFALSTAFKRVRGDQPAAVPPHGDLTISSTPAPTVTSVRGDALVGVDELGELDQLLGVRERVVDHEQAASAQHAHQLGPVAGVLRALGVEEDQVERAVGEARAAPRRRPACAARRTSSTPACGEVVERLRGALGLDLQADSTVPPTASAASPSQIVE